MTAQGHPRAIFKRAVHRGNLVMAEATAREIGRLTLDEALRLLFLYAEKEPIKFERAALRWLSRYATEGKAVSLLKAQLALGADGAAGWGARGGGEAREAGAGGRASAGRTPRSLSSLSTP